ncbi:MAG: ABC-2 transporter permease, partial [Thermoguttaceae bacterium]|nr:ABC-2 transporter permease [Thermoguttaceae bacterium]
MLPVFKRNFTAYFLNPTGYVFICVFVLLSSIAAFLPDEFVNSNLANLAQLNLWYPLIQLVFIPAITMGIWADERRQGTEELLMTMPLSSGQIVLGKYLASTGIYTISLLVSAISNLAILEFLGNPDIGLFLSTYLGYWLIGLTMLSIAAVASFLT